MSLREKFGKFAKERRNLPAAGLSSFAALSFGALGAFTVATFFSGTEKGSAAVIKNNLISQYQSSLKPLSDAVLDGFADRVEAGEKGIVKVPVEIIPYNIEIDLGRANAAEKEYLGVFKTYGYLLSGLFGLASVVSAGMTVSSLRRREDAPKIIHGGSTPPGP